MASRPSFSEPRHDLSEARRDLAAWLGKWSAKYSRLTGWVEENIDETLTFYRLPRQHHKHLKSTNMLEKDVIAAKTFLSRRQGDDTGTGEHASLIISCGAAPE
jgi:transposase-like protein